VPGHEKDWKIAEIWGEQFLIPKEWDVTKDKQGVTWLDGFKWIRLI